MATPTTPQASDVPLNALSLTFGSPLCSERAQLLTEELVAVGPESVIDIGCGWGELLLRTLDAAPGAQGLGIDLEASDIERARSLAEQRGVQGRVEFLAEDASEFDGTADALICMGAWHALGSTPAEALQRLRGLTEQRGRLVFGVDHWAQLPDQQRLSRMWESASLADSSVLPDVVDAAASAGWRLVDLHEATQDEWNHFECGVVRNQELWLVDHPDHPEADELRRRLDAGRRSWLSGHYGHMGFATLVLAAA